MYQVDMIKDIAASTAPSTQLLIVLNRGMFDFYDLFFFADSRTEDIDSFVEVAVDGQEEEHRMLHQTQRRLMIVETDRGMRTLMI
ncbi:MAG: hypothetical protein ACKPKO_26005 [Candidatus Fonsibacter sp.]